MGRPAWVTILPDQTGNRVSAVILGRGLAHNLKWHGMSLRPMGRMSMPLKCSGKPESSCVGPESRVSVETLKEYSTVTFDEVASELHGSHCEVHLDRPHMIAQKVTTENLVRRDDTQGCYLSR